MQQPEGAEQAALSLQEVEAQAQEAQPAAVRECLCRKRQPQEREDVRTLRNQGAVLKTKSEDKEKNSLEVV